MKKYLSLLLLALLLWGCAQESAAPAVTAEPTTVTTAPMETTAATEPTVVTTQPPLPQIFPDQIGIYVPAEDGTRSREKIAGMVVDRKAKTDIDCFEVFASQLDRIEGNSFASMWQEAWQSHEATENAKIGFHIRFALADGTMVSKVILKPGDAKAFYDYLEVYLYDDVNQTPGVRYTHLEDDEIGENTVISSIKLTSGAKIDQVGDINLTAFIYNGEACFDQDGNYIGDVFATIYIKEKE